MDFPSQWQQKVRNFTVFSCDLPSGKFLVKTVFSLLSRLIYSMKQNLAVY